MNIINQFSRNLNILMAATILVIVLFGALAYYFIKIRKVASKEEKVDYSTFQRKDSVEYIKFDDIVSDGVKNAFNASGAIVLEDGKTFVAGLDVVGYQFGSAAAEEQQATMIHSVSVFNLVEHPIQLRQSVTGTDLSHNIDVEEALLKNLTIEFMDLNAECEKVLAQAEDHIDEPDDYEVIKKHLDSLVRQRDAKEWMIREEQAQIDYMKSMSSGEKDAQKVNQFMFSYTFNPNDFTEEQTHEAIYLRALSELNNKGNAFKAALERCGFSCRRLTSGELVDLMRKHCHPLTAGDIRLEELFHSSYNSLFVTSDSLLELEKAKLSDAAYQEMLDELYKDNQSVIDTFVLDARRSERMMQETVSEEIKEQGYNPYADFTMM